MKRKPVQDLKGHSKKKQKLNKQEVMELKINDKIKSSEYSILNKLSRLFEKSSQGCTALCFVNNKILITDNNIYASSTGEKEKDFGKLTVIASVMDYFSKLAGGEISPEDEKSTFRKLCISRLRGEKSGTIILSDEALEVIADTALQKYKRARTEQQNSKKKLQAAIENATSEINSTNMDHAVDALPLIYYATAHAVLLARDFVKIQDFLTDSKNADNPLKKAVQAGELKDEKGTVINVQGIGENVLNYDGYMLMQDKNSEQKGYVILKIDKDVVHAEVKMVEYLLYTEVLQKTKGQGIYIAISKLCCYDCALTILAVNSVLKSQKIKAQVLYAGTHGLVFSTTQPLLLSNEVPSTQYSYCYYKYDKKLKEHSDTPIMVKSKNVKNIMEEMEKLNEENAYVYIYPDNQIVSLIKNEYTKLKEYWAPNPNTSIHMTKRSPSTSRSDSTENFVEVVAASIEDKKAEQIKTYLTIVGNELTKSCKFVGVVEANSMLTKADSYKLLKAGEKVLGIYKDEDGKFIVFCIEGRKGKPIKVSYIDRFSSTETKTFIDIVRKVWDVKKLNHILGDAELMQGSDYEIYALEALKEFAMNPQESTVTEKSSKNRIALSRQSFDDIYTQVRLGITKKELDSTYYAWNKLYDNNPGVIEDLEKVIKNTTIPTEEKEALLLMIVKQSEALKNIIVSQEKTLLDVLLDNKDPIALVEELALMHAIKGKKVVKTNPSPTTDVQSQKTQVTKKLKSVKHQIWQSKLVEEVLNEAKKDEKVASVDKPPPKAIFIDLRSVDSSSSNDDSHLKRTEKLVLTSDQGVGKLKTKAQYNLHQHLIALNAGRKDFAQELHRLSRKSQTQSKKSLAEATKVLYTQLVTENKGTVTILPEHNHLIDHYENTSALLESIKAGKIPQSTVIALERKQYGANLGMQDVTLLADIMRYNEKHQMNQIAIPKEVQNSLIYQDAKLYKAAQEHDIVIVGVEGKGLDTHKGSEGYDVVREKHMSKLLEAISMSGHDVILCVGAAHVENLQSSMAGKDIRTKVVEDISKMSFDEASQSKEGTKAPEFIGKLKRSETSSYDKSL